MTDPLESVTLPQVKLIRMLPPAVALMVVGTWLGPQRRSMATLEQDCALLRHRLADPAMQKEMGRRTTARHPVGELCMEPRKHIKSNER